jgi:hypothetical protein
VLTPASWNDAPAGAGAAAGDEATGQLRVLPALPVLPVLRGLQVLAKLLARTHTMSTTTTSTKSMMSIQRAQSTVSTCHPRTAARALRTTISEDRGRRPALRRGH